MNTSYIIHTFCASYLCLESWLHPHECGDVNECCTWMMTREFFKKFKVWTFFKHWFGGVMWMGIVDVEEQENSKVQGLALNMQLESDYVALGAK